MLHIFLLTNFLLLFGKFSLVFVAESFNISLILFVFQLLWFHMRKASVSGSGLTEGKFILSFAWLLERILTNFTCAFFQFSLISLSPAFLAHCVTTYFLLVFFKLPLTLLLLQNISCRIPLVGLSQNYCKSYIIVLFNLLPCKYFDWFVELEELGNVCNHDVHVWGNSGSLIPFSFAIKTDKKRNPFFGFHEKFCGVFLKVPVIEDFVNFCKLCPDCNHSWCCFCFARFPIKMSVTVSIKWSSSTTIRSSGIFNSFVYFTLCTSIVGCCPLESKHL